MAVKTYVANRLGQAPNGAIIAEGQTFAAEFVKIERDDKGVIKRNGDGEPITKAADAPDWADEVKEAKSTKKKSDD